MSKAWKCPCTSPYNVNLILEQRPKTNRVSGGQHALSQQDVSFEVDFGLKQAPIPMPLQMVRTTVLVVNVGTVCTSTPVVVRKRYIDIVTGVSHLSPVRAPVVLNQGRRFYLTFCRNLAGSPPLLTVFIARVHMNTCGKDVACQPSRALVYATSKQRKPR